MHSRTVLARSWDAGNNLHSSLRVPLTLEPGLFSLQMCERSFSDGLHLVLGELEKPEIDNKTSHFFWTDKSGWSVNAWVMADLSRQPHERSGYADIFPAQIVSGA